MKNNYRLSLIGLGVILIILGLLVVNYFGWLVLIPMIVGIVSIIKGALSRKNPRKKDELESEEKNRKVEVYDVEEKEELIENQSTEKKETEENEEDEIDNEASEEAEDKTTKFCHECGEEIDVEVNYCPKCGAKQ